MIICLHVDRFGGLADAFHLFSMQASGVAVNDECVSLFNELKLKHDKKYIVYKMNSQMTQIEVFLPADGRFFNAN